MPAPAVTAPVPGFPAAVRRLSVAALVVAFLHVVFGAIVRITGSGMGCLTSWPRCADPATGVVAWFPPFDQPTLVIEWLHRLFAAVLISTIAALVVTAFARRETPGVGGRGGVLRAAAAALGVSFVAAAFAVFSPAVVVPAAGQTVTLEDLVAFCDGRIARFKTPRSLDVVDALPLSAAGKVLKRELRRPHRPPG